MLLEKEEGKLIITKRHGTHVGFTYIAYSTATTTRLPRPHIIIRLTSVSSAEAVHITQKGRRNIFSHHFNMLLYAEENWRQPQFPQKETES